VKEPVVLVFRVKCVQFDDKSRRKTKAESQNLKKIFGYKTFNSIYKFIGFTY